MATGYTVAMKDKTYLGLFLLIVGFIVVDTMLGTGGTLFLLKKLADLIEFLAFWR